MTTRSRALVPVAALASLAAAADLAPPRTRVDEVVETLHGVAVRDPYRWLEDQDSPETRAWIDAQNAYTEAVLGAAPGREEVRRRLSELMRIDVADLPQERGGRYFFTRRAADQDLPVIAMRRGRSGPDEVLVDPHPWSPDRTRSAALLAVSEDGRLLAYGVREGGEDEVEVRVFDVDGRRDLPDRLPRARYWALSFTPDRAAFYYTRFGPEGPRVRRHRLGDDPAGDPLVFGEGLGPEKIVQSSLSEDGRWLLIEVSHGSAARQTEVYVKDVGKDGPLVTVVADVEARFDAAIAGSRLYLRTEWQAPNGRILAVDLEDPARERWREVVPAGPGVITGFLPAGGRLVVRSLEDVVARLRVHGTDGRLVREVPLPTLGTVAGMKGRFASDEVFFSFESFHVPPTIHRLDLSTGASSVWFRTAVPVDEAAFEVRQASVTSKDGTRVPVFLLHRKGLEAGSPRATLLTGYGGFRITRTPTFSARAALWAERGGVYALASLRGGGEYGEEWHRAGMLDRKQNTFDDFVAAAEWLVASGTTRPDRLAIFGGSNGGLLVGAAFTQRPELFGAVVCAVPLLDMVRYHRFLVARFWIPEYGSAEDPDQFRTLFAYSPYHRVVDGTRYPAVLLVSGDSDTRVAPLHARKMAARLQAASASGRPVLLHYDTKAGHSSGKPVSRQIDDTTDELVFLLWQVGQPPGRPEGAAGP